MLKENTVVTARLLSGKSQTELAREVGIPQPSVSELERGLVNNTETTRKHLDRIAEVTGVSPSFFFRRDLDTEPAGAMHRTRKTGVSSKKQAQLRALGNVVIASLSELAERHVDVETRFHLLEGLDEMRPADAALELRERLGVGYRPIRSIAQVLDHLGICAYFFSDYFEPTDGFTLRGTDYLFPVVFAMAGRSVDRTRLTFAHELGHIVLHRHRVKESQEEDEAWEFASEFVAPIQELRKDVLVSGNVSIQTLIALKRKWGLSMAAINTYLKKAGVLSSTRAESLYKMMSAKGYRRREPVELPEENPGLISSMFSAVKDQGFGLSEIAADVGLGDELFLRLFGRYWTNRVLRFVDPDDR